MIISAAKKEKTPAAVRMVKDIFGNLKLISELSKNDLKKRFADSYFGILWAFVSPIITICVYWFVFTVGMRGGGNEVNGYPYVLWLISGLIPWFLFSDILTSGTSVLLEYAYLVKKIVFNVSILPFDPFVVYVAYFCRDRTFSGYLYVTDTVLYHCIMVFFHLLCVCDKFCCPVFQGFRTAGKYLYAGIYLDHANHVAGCIDCRKPSGSYWNPSFKSNVLHRKRVQGCHDQSCMVLG